MRLFRACKNTDVFPGAHFTDDATEAEVYTWLPINNGGDALGGRVFEYECGGDVLTVESVKELVNVLQGWSESGDVNAEEFGLLYDVAMTFATEGPWGRDEFHEIDSADICKDLRQFHGIEYVFQLIEQCEGVSTALNDSEYAWIEWTAYSLKEENENVETTTYLYLGGGEAVLVK